MLYNFFIRSSLLNSQNCQFFSIEKEGTKLPTGCQKGVPVFHKISKWEFFCEKNLKYEFNLLSHLH